MTHPCHVPDCGQRRCDRCDERMCCTGPEPAVTCSAHVECVDCEADNPCRDCATIRRATAVADRAWEAAANPGPHIDPRSQADIDAAAEERKDRRAFELAQLEDREGVA